MNKVELVSAIYERLDGKKTKKDIEAVLNASQECIMEAVAEGEKVTLIGFGTFTKREKKERRGRNPATGEAIEIPKSTVARFNPGKVFKDTVNV